MTDQPNGADPAPDTAPPVDLGNALLRPADAQLALAQVTIADQPLVVVTIRTATTTLSVHLAPEDAVRWGTQLTATGRGTGGGGGLIIPTNGVPTLDPGLAEAIRRQANGGRG
jgi:hypothetical protein